MPTTSSCRFLRILAHIDGSRQAWVRVRNTSGSVLTAVVNGLLGIIDKIRDDWPAPRTNRCLSELRRPKPSKVVPTAMWV
jgi:hypothetical protein